MPFAVPRLSGIDNHHTTAALTEALRALSHLDKKASKAAEACRHTQWYVSSALTPLVFASLPLGLKTTPSSTVSLSCDGDTKLTRFAP